MERGFDAMAGHLTDIKDMVVDQNEWYEEIFYDGVSPSNPSGVFDINDDLPTFSDTQGSKIGTELGAGVRRRRAEKGT